MRTWIDIITTAHRLGIPHARRRSCTATSRRRAHVVRHLELIRAIQKETGGFTEFVPLRFIHDLHGAVPQRPRTTRRRKALSTSACTPSARLMLRGRIDNLQTSWVKLGTELAQLSLNAGCNDFGGTLMEERSPSEAGADAGEYTPVAEIRRLDRRRRPASRRTHNALWQARVVGGERAACVCDRS